MAPPSLYFGGGTIGADHLNTTNGVANLLQSLQKLDIWRLDTAPVYPATNPGKCEQVLGDVGAIQLGFRVATKIKVIGAGPGKGSLTKDAIDASIAESLAKLRTEQVDVLYCHTPDIETPVEETAAALHAQYERQRFLQLGLSNYNADQVQEYLTICEQHGYIKPTVYQGSYNAVARQAEERLLPLLRKHGITFIAYSPLAGGFLTGKLTNQTSLSGSRFEKGHPMGDFIRGIYDKPAMHSAVRTLQSVLDQERMMGSSSVRAKWSK